MNEEAGASWSEPLYQVGSRNWRPRYASALGRMQREAMALRFPGLTMTVELPWISVWEGELRPLSQSHRVRITDHRGSDDGRIVFVGRWPSVRVLTPVALRAETPGEPVPHIYGRHDDPRGTDLCLFHPASRDWTDDMLLADSIVPWAAEWLFYYEMWHVTGMWGGEEAPHSDGPAVRDPIRRGGCPRQVRRIEAPLMRNMLYRNATDPTSRN